MKCVQFMGVFLLVYFAFASTNSVWTLWSVHWIWYYNSLYSLPHHTHHTQFGSLVAFLREVFTNIVFCYVTNVQFGNILTFQRHNLHMKLQYIRTSYSHILDSYFIVSAVRHSNHMP